MIVTENRYLFKKNGAIWLNDRKTEPRAAFFSPETSEYIRVIKQSMLSFGWMGPLFPSAARIRQVVNEMLKDLGLKNGADGRGPAHVPPLHRVLSLLCRQHADRGHYVPHGGHRGHDPGPVPAPDADDAEGKGGQGGWIGIEQENV